MYWIGPALEEALGPIDLIWLLRPAPLNCNPSPLERSLGYLPWETPSVLSTSAPNGVIDSFFRILHGASPYDLANHPWKLTGQPNFRSAAMQEEQPTSTSFSSFGELKLPKNRSTGNLLQKMAQNHRGRIRFSLDASSTVEYGEAPRWVYPSPLLSSLHR